jgi:hypothetical protein
MSVNIPVLSLSHPFFLFQSRESIPVRPRTRVTLTSLTGTLCANCQHLCSFLVQKQHFGARAALTWQSPFWRKWIMWEVSGLSFWLRASSRYGSSSIGLSPY